MIWNSWESEFFKYGRLHHIFSDITVIATRQISFSLKGGYHSGSLEIQDKVKIARMK